MSPDGNKDQTGFIQYNAKVKVTRSFSLVSFERASLVECRCVHAKYEAFVSYSS